MSGRPRQVQFRHKAGLLRLPEQDAGIALPCLDRDGQKAIRAGRDGHDLLIRLPGQFQQGWPCQRSRPCRCP